MLLKFLILLALACQALAQYNDDHNYHNRRSNSNERCFQHEDFPEPSECCTRPLWINQYLVRPCRFSNSPRGGERETCSASCGIYKIDMIIFNNQVDSVRLFRPGRLRGYADQDWRRSVLSALKLCKQRITSMVGRRISNGQELEQCDEANDVLSECLDEQLFLRCPDRVWIRSAGCQQSKNHLMQGCSYDSLTENTKRQWDQRYDQNHRRSRNGGYDQHGDPYDDDFDGYDEYQPRNRNNRNNNNNNQHNVET